MNRKHALLMVLCCLIPLAAFTAISILRVPVNAVIYAAIVLACPAMHLLMMRGMANHAGEHPHHQGRTSQAMEGQEHTR
jgi:uncharacterized membrane protein